MFITFDYRCGCGHTEERFVKRAEMDDQKCSKCDRLMLRLPAGTRTTFRYADVKLKD